MTETGGNALPCKCGGYGVEHWPDSSTRHYIECDNCGRRTATYLASHGGSARDEWISASAQAEKPAPDGLEVEGRGIYDCANQLMGYVGPDTEPNLAQFLIREGKSATALADALVQAQSLIAELRGEMDEARRRRDEWRKKAEGYDEVRLALREKVGAPWPPNMSRILWAGIAAAERTRAETAEAEVKRLTEANNALMSERTSLIETKREQIKRLTEENEGLRKELDTPLTHDIGVLVPVQKLRAAEARIKALEEIVKCALDEYETREGRIVDENDPHWSVAARTTLNSREKGE